MQRQHPLVLVVDDDLDVREAFTDALHLAGYDVITMPDGRLALDFLPTQQPPDVILLDMVMPGRDGFEFRKTQLARPDWADVPTIVISADRMVPQRWQETRLAGFLTK